MKLYESSAGSRRNTFGVPAGYKRRASHSPAAPPRLLVTSGAFFRGEWDSNQSHKLISGGSTPPPGTILPQPPMRYRNTPEQAISCAGREGKGKCGGNMRTEAAPDDPQPGTKQAVKPARNRIGQSFPCLQGEQISRQGSARAIVPIVGDSRGNLAPIGRIPRFLPGWDGGLCQHLPAPYGMPLRSGLPLNDV